MKLIINSYRRKCLVNQTTFRILRHKLKNMKTVIKVLVGIFLGLGLFQLVDLSLYLMNQSDTYLFNIGIVLFGIIFIAFGYLGLYLMKIIKPEKEENEL